jgi:hypothetical protein
MCRADIKNNQRMFFWHLDGERYQEEVCSKCNKILLQHKQIQEKYTELNKPCIIKFQEQLKRRGENSDHYFASLENKKK